MIGMNKGLICPSIAMGLLESKCSMMVCRCRPVTNASPWTASVNVLQKEIELRDVNARGCGSDSLALSSGEMGACVYMP